MFLCAVQMVPSCGLTVHFCLLFLIKEKNPRRGVKNSKTKDGGLIFYLEEHLTSEVT